MNVDNAPWWKSLATLNRVAMGVLCWEIAWVVVSISLKFHPLLGVSWSSLTSIFSRWVGKNHQLVTDFYMSFSQNLCIQSLYPIWILPWEFNRKCLQRTCHGGLDRPAEAYFWRNDAGELELGVFDWGGMGCRSLGILTNFFCDRGKRLGKVGECWEWQKVMVRLWTVWITKIAWYLVYGIMYNTYIHIQLIYIYICYKYIRMCFFLNWSKLFLFRMMLKLVVKYEWKLSHQSRSSRFPPSHDFFCRFELRLVLALRWSSWRCNCCTWIRKNQCSESFDHIFCWDFGHAKGFLPPALSAVSVLSKPMSFFCSLFFACLSLQLKIES